MQTILTSVASAAVISGDLIIGLSDGSIINCGRVQGPIGLTGDQGPMGATGRSGSDGNTIHTVQGVPDTTLGKDGDFAINVKIWEIYAPRAGGAWGSGTPLRGNKRNGGSDQKDNIFGNNAPSEGGGDNRPPIISPDGDLIPPTIYPGAKPLKTGDFWVDGNGALHVYYRGGWNKIRVYSDSVLAAGDAPTGSTREYNGGTGSAIAEAANGETFANQYEFNNWLYYRVERSPVLADSEPAEHPDFPVTGLKPGDFWINSGNQLFTWKANQWVPLFAKGLIDVSDNPPLAPQKGQAWFDTEADELTLYIYTGSEWVPAAPPVSLDGINATIKSALVVQSNLVDAVTKGIEEQNKIKLDLEELKVAMASLKSQMENEINRHSQ